MNVIKEFMEEEDGIGVVEIILILVILIALVLLFKNEITAIIESAFTSIKSGSESIIDE